MAPRAKGVQTKKYEQEHVQKALVKMIIMDELPFSVVEQDEFKELMEAAFPGFQIPSPEMISRDCSHLFMNEKLKLKSVIKKTKPRVCLTLDTWKSNQSVSYLCITAHFIDDIWKLHKKIISFTPIVSDKGDDIGRVVEKCLHDWQISNVLTISTRNGVSNDAVLGYLRGKLADTLLEGKFLHLKCMLDFTHLLVKKVLNEHEKSITRVRAAVRYVVHSADRVENFKECARESGISFKSALSLDCPTSWAETFKMLKISEKFEQVFNFLERKDPAYKHDLKGTCGVPDHKDWEKVRKVVNFLEGFYRSTENILGLSVTSNQFLVELAGLDFHFANCGKSIFASNKTMMMALEMKWKYDEYWGDVEKSNMLIYVANILDPRSRTDFIEYYFMNIYKHDHTDDGESLWKKKAELVIAATYELFNEYVGKIGAPQQKAKFQSCGYKQYLYEDTSHLGLFMKHEIGFGGNAGCKTEIDIYLSEDPVQDFAGFDMLLWWKYNSARYPILSKMAKDVLAIPVSAVAPESAYCIGGNILDDFQSSLSPSTIEALVCTQDWICKSIKKKKVKGGSPNLDNFLKGICLNL